MTYNVFGGTLNLTRLNSTLSVLMLLMNYNCLSQ